MRTSSRYSKTIRFAITALFLVCAAGALPAQTSKKKAAKPDPFLTGPPWTFEEVLKGAADLFPARLQAVIESRGVDFFPTQEQEKQLRDAGANEAVIELIERKGAAHKAAPKPKPKLAGTLTLTCAPVECNIEINGKPAGSTAGGIKHVDGLVVGTPPSVAVDFKKDGYIGQQFVIPLKVGATASKSAILLPTEETQRRFGNDAVSALLTNLGGKEGWHDAGWLRANGSANLFQSGGQRSVWNVDARLKTPEAMAYLEIEGAGLKYWISLKGSDTKVGGSGKLKGGPVAIEMEKIVRQYRDLQPVVLLAHIVNRKMTLTSATPPGGDAEVTVKASGPTETYTLTIAPNGLLSRAVYESATGLGSGMTVVYGDYVGTRKAKLPKIMDIRFADQAQHGMEFRFESITSDPNLPDKEFHR
ncbi:MAG TPA: hypothetical protein VHD76_03025 [Bryobacteraceae bacterium]|nr:hypothetical protein [Bryobacteraceae bacterium]